MTSQYKVKYGSSTILYFHNSIPPLPYFYNYPVALLQGLLIKESSPSRSLLSSSLGTAVTSVVFLQNIHLQYLFDFTISNRNYEQLWQAVSYLIPRGLFCLPVLLSAACGITRRMGHHNRLKLTSTENVTFQSCNIKTTQSSVRNYDGKNIALCNSKIIVVQFILRKSDVLQGRKTQFDI